MLTQEQINEGNIVETYKFKGCTVYISDAFYSKQTPEQLEAIRENALRIMADINIRHQMREMGLL
ncbi:MAG: hypothetical protein RR209_00420 [Angelakisella sp.]